MPPIPVYSSSPITAAKPSGVTPKTANPGEPHQSSQPQPETSPVGTQSRYTPAQPGAVPSLPKPTGAPQPGNVDVAATPTRTSALRDGPPPPQPGAVPVPLGSRTPSDLPPPPRAGESLRPQQEVPVTTMPPQMGYQPPQASLPIQGRSSTATTAPPTMMTSLPPQNGSPATRTVQGNYPTAGYSPPAGGYQQDVNAAGFSQHQGLAAASEEQGEAGVWDTAKKWAASAGESLAAAESKVWKRINKD
ncbi:uncharacterized protein UV8b_03533 [Ustilaginoidea virens]|uniref:Uncharacterized protein n=1 Tax=Ustilaginoidea virens TaxID=1159556 RepID=A0A063C1Y3_USTVR|nr:uncharacterized protein UV8b_03533 [Ustilaginoidea virens]QUC19292.1 hypothetical protein UV8b_03533 [Ustilaginoidea virens]GAO13137.1 hypothetical protein UVI_02024950 [Ustilaginoidea virens]